MKTPDDMLDPEAAGADLPDLSEPSEEELKEAEALRLALEDPSRANEGADLLRALSLAHAPRPLDDAAHRRIVDQALARAAKEREARAKPARGVVVRMAFGAAAALSLAAGAVLFMQTSRSLDGGATQAQIAAPPLVQVRSTAPLFREPFEARGGTSARIDRIAMARAEDLRENRFARWGVR